MQNKTTTPVYSFLAATFFLTLILSSCKKDAPAPVDVADTTTVVASPPDFRDEYAGVYTCKYTRTHFMVGGATIIEAVVNNYPIDIQLLPTDSISINVVDTGSLIHSYPAMHAMLDSFYCAECHGFDVIKFFRDGSGALDSIFIRKPSGPMGTIIITGTK